MASRARGALSRTALSLSPLELLERIARLIPPPRVHRHRYHGLLAPHARLRPIVIAIGRERSAEPEPISPAPNPRFSPPPVPEPAPASSGERPSRIRWVQLLARIYEVLPLLCPACGGEMSILAFLTDPPVVGAILLHLGLPHQPPPVTPARGPPQAELSLDQTPRYDPADPEPLPDLDFDQSLPEAWDA